MKKIHHFVFNSFGVNAYVLVDESGKCLLVDPACNSAGEVKKLADFITRNSLTPVSLINTHFHIDHIVGNTAIGGLYGLKPLCHAQSRLFWETAPQFGSVFGINVDDMVIPTEFIADKQTIHYGNSSAQVLYTPGHADGSVCLVNHAEHYVITGDVLFRDSIGRTDLPTGDFDLLFESITQKLFTLPDGFVVYPGHGPSTTIGYEKLNNPFLR